jgi:hypothetical protein
VSDELKRFVLMAILFLMLALGFLIPLSRWKVTPHPSGVPTTGVLADAPDGSKLWIDCPTLSGSQFHCSIYQPNGDLLLAGVFQHAGFAPERRVHFDGSNIYWRFGAVLRPLRLDCVRGGRSPSVPDCENGVH